MIRWKIMTMVSDEWNGKQYENDTSHSARANDREGWNGEVRLLSHANLRSVMLQRESMQAKEQTSEEVKWQTCWQINNLNQGQHMYIITIQIS